MCFIARLCFQASRGVMKEWKLPMASRPGSPSNKLHDNIMLHWFHLRRDTRVAKTKKGKAWSFLRMTQKWLKPSLWKLTEQTESRNDFTEFWILSYLFFADNQSKLRPRFDDIYNCLELAHILLRESALPPRLLNGGEWTLVGSLWSTRVIMGDCSHCAFHKGESENAYYWMCISNCTVHVYLSHVYIYVSHLLLC